MSRLLTAFRANVNSARRLLIIAAAAPDRASRRRTARALLADSCGPIVADEIAAQQVAAEGFAPWELDARLWTGLRESYQNLSRRHERPADERRSGKEFFEEILAAPDLGAERVLLNCALDRRLLLTVMRGMGLVPHLESVEIYVSRPSGNTSSASQLWHRDVNDAAIVKLFVYLGEVGPSNGPFTFIPAPVSARVPVGPDHYMTDEMIDAGVSRAQWRTVEGAPGTAFLIDTHRCLHFGSRCTEPRVAYVATFSSGGKFGTHSRSWRHILGQRALDLDELQRMVCGISS